MRWTVVLGLAVATAASLSVNAAGGTNIEGMWKISAPQTSFRPESGSIPFTDAGRQRYLANKRAQAKRDYDSYDYATSRCASPGLPRLMLTPDRFRIWQRSGQVLFQFEWNRLTRQIEMGDLVQPQLRVGEGSSIEGTDDDALVGRAVPISKGRWDGDTLIAASDGFVDNTLIDDLVPHGYQLKLIERMRLKDADTLEARITVEDPEFFTRPWQTVVTYKRQPDAGFPEDVCLERIEAGQPAFVLNK